MFLAAALWAGRRGAGDGLLSRYVFVRAMQLQQGCAALPVVCGTQRCSQASLLVKRDQIGVAAANTRSRKSRMRLFAKSLLFASVLQDASCSSRAQLFLRVEAVTCKTTVRYGQLCTHASRSDSHHSPRSRSNLSTAHLLCGARDRAARHRHRAKQNAPLRRNVPKQRRRRRRLDGEREWSRRRAICRVTTHDNTTAARLSSSGEAIVSCGVDVALCATRDATVALRLGDSIEGAPRGLLQCCDFDQSSRLVCVGGEGGLLDVWDCKRRRIVRTLEDHGSSITACRFDSTSTCVASGNAQGEVLIHKVRSRQLLALLAEAQQPPITTLEYSPLRPHHFGALHGDGSLRLWDVDRSTKIAKLGGGRATTDLLGLAFSPVNAKFLAAARVDGAVAFWDADSGVCVKALDVGGRCTSLAFATERVVVVGADDGRLVGVRPAVDGGARVACRRARRRRAVAAVR